MKWTARLSEDRKGQPDYFIISNGDQVFMVQERLNGLHITYRRAGSGGYRSTIYKFKSDPTPANLAYVEAALQSPPYEKWDRTQALALKHVIAWGGKPEAKAFFEVLPKAMKNLLFLERLRRIARNTDFSKKELDDLWNVVCVEEVMEI